MPWQSREDLSIRIQICRQQLAVTKHPQARDILQVMIENMEDRLEALSANCPSREDHDQSASLKTMTDPDDARDTTTRAISSR